MLLFEPLITLQDFKDISGDTTTPDNVLTQFLNRAYYMFIAFGLPPSLNGEPEVITEEAYLTHGSSTSVGGYLNPSVASYGKDYIQLENPILELIEVRLKLEFEGSCINSDCLPFSNFQFIKYQNFIESSFCNSHYLSGLEAVYYPYKVYGLGGETYVEVTYTTGIEQDAKKDFLNALNFMSQDVGYNFVPRPAIGAGAFDVRADDTSISFNSNPNNPNDTNLSNYVEKTPFLIRLLKKYKPLEKIVH